MVRIWSKRTIKKDILILMKRNPDKVYTYIELQDIFGLTINQLKKAKEYLLKDGCLDTGYRGRFKLTERSRRSFNPRIFNRCVFLVNKHNGYTLRPYCTIHNKFLDYTAKCHGTVVIEGDKRFIVQSCPLWEPSSSNRRDIID